MSARLKGFIFGAVLMLIPPAMATTGTPLASAVPEVEKTQTLPYFRLTYEDAEGALGQALAERGAGVKVEAKITNRDEDFMFSYSQPISVEIRGLRFDATTRRFTANMASVAGKDVLSVKAITGRFEEMVEVPVLKQSKRAGDIIQASDLELRNYPKARARSDTLTDISSLVGKSPGRVISAGRPIRVQELAQPTMVKKNDMVKMIFNQGMMAISTNGQAMTSGAKGSVIGVKNLTSKKIVHGTVQDENTVLISSGEMQTSSLATGSAHEN